MGLPSRASREGKAKSRSKGDKLSLACGAGTMATWADGRLYSGYGDRDSESSPALRVYPSLVIHSHDAPSLRDRHCRGGQAREAKLIDKAADLFWLHVFGCVPGFDWHSSGLTGTSCGALKEGLCDVGNELGLLVSGGKGKPSRRTD